MPARQYPRRREAPEQPVETSETAAVLPALGGERPVTLYSADFLRAYHLQFTKTALCTFYNTASGCAHGRRCRFAHGSSELRQKPDLSKTSLCEAWSRGRCPLEESACPYAHGAKHLRATLAALGENGRQAREMPPIGAWVGRAERPSTTSEDSTAASSDWAAEEAQAAPENLGAPWLGVLPAVRELMQWDSLAAGLCLASAITGDESLVRRSAGDLEALLAQASVTHYAE